MLNVTVVFSRLSFLFSLLTTVDEILSRSQALFSDVQDEFCDVKKILSRFEEWRGSYSDSYHSAYISLCLPKLLNPIIRHQLLAWNPLKVPSEWLTQRCEFTYHLAPCYQHEVLCVSGYYWWPGESTMVHSSGDFLSRSWPRGAWSHRQTDAVYYHRKDRPSQNDRYFSFSLAWPKKQSSKSVLKKHQKLLIIFFL